jgi:hypothetical protein
MSDIMSAFTSSVKPEKMKRDPGSVWSLQPKPNTNKYTSSLGAGGP